jgi:arylsulfatase A-like enzyme
VNLTQLLRRLATLLAATALLASASSSVAAPRPNVLLILSDDMGWSDLGCYGSEITTPNLDSLAAKGLRFTQFYNGARCCPTRASLLTGLYAHMAGVGHMTSDSHRPGYRGELNDRCLTIGEVMRPAGYRTYAVGKWHVARDIKPDGPKYDWPMQRGFDKFYGTITGGGNYYDPTTLCRGNTYITPENDPEYHPSLFYYTDAITDNAIAFLKQHRAESPKQPFFMYLAYTAAHWPMHAKPADIAKYKGKYDAGYDAIRQRRFERQKQLGLVKPDWTPAPTVGDWSNVPHKEWEIRCMEVYAAMVDCLDQGIGRVVNELKAEGQLDNTLVFFLQDNGACAEDMGRNPSKEPYRTDLKPMTPDELQPKIWPPMQTRDGRPVRTGPEAMPGPADTYVAYGKAWANVSNTPFREYKHWVHEGGISTPLIVHWPKGIPASREGLLEWQPGHLVDLMATCVDVAGAKYPRTRNGHPINALAGVSLQPAFRGKSLHRAAPIYWEHEGNRALREGQWKIVAKGPAGAWELYDMAADRTESHDLAAQDPDRIKAMISRWEAWANQNEVLPWIWKPPYGQ